MTTEEKAKKMRERKGIVKHVSFNDRKVIVLMEDGTEQVIIYSNKNMMPSLGESVLDVTFD